MENKKIEISDLGDKVLITLEREGITELYKYNKRDKQEILIILNYQLGLMDCFDPKESKSFLDIATNKLHF